MARFVYGFELYRPQQQAHDYFYPGYGANSEVFAKGDPVAAGATGLVVAGTTATVIGIAVRDQTMSSTNQTAAKVRPALIPTNPEYEFLASGNADMNSLTQIGITYQLVGTTGAIMVDVTTGTRAAVTNAAVIICTDIDPDREGGAGDEGGARLGVFRFVKGVNAPNSRT